MSFFLSTSFSFSGFGIFSINSSQWDSLAASNISSLSASTISGGSSSGIATGTQYETGVGWVGVTTYMGNDGELRVKKEILVAMSGISTGNTPIYDKDPSVN